MLRHLLLLLLLPLVLNVTALTAQVTPTLDDQSQDAWREHILPSEEDLVWQKIAWHATFADGIMAADEADKPLLLWTMNGHPFGCT